MQCSILTVAPRGEGDRVVHAVEVALEEAAFVSSVSDGTSEKGKDGSRRH